MNTPTSHPPTQTLVIGTLKSVFGDSNVVSRNERLKRFLEEAVELVRTGGLTREEIGAVVAYELSRPIGPDLTQELGGAGVTLYALAGALGQNLDVCVTKEVGRIGANSAKCRAKHATKPASVLSPNSVANLPESVGGGLQSG